MLIVACHHLFSCCILHCFSGFLALSSLQPLTKCLTHVWITVNSPNNGRFCARSTVRYSGGVLYWGMTLFKQQAQKWNYNVSTSGLPLGPRNITCTIQSNTKWHRFGLLEVPQIYCISHSTVVLCIAMVYPH